jgi:DNA-binding transcriptional LysR family regulator
LGPQVGSVVNLVAAELGVSIIPVSMNQLQVSGVVYRPITKPSPLVRLALAYRRGETSPVVRNFMARAVVRAKGAKDPDAKGRSDRPQ